MGNIRCMACNKICDGVHETTKEHEKRLEQYLWQLSADDQEYPEPHQPWLAYVPDTSYGKGRYLKCLLCKKWVQDWEALDTQDYSGNHGNKGPNNQKDHAKKMRYWEEYSDDVLAEKWNWHPAREGSAAGSAVRGASVRTAAATAAGASSVAEHLPSGMRGAPPPDAARTAAAAAPRYARAKQVELQQPPPPPPPPPAPPCVPSGWWPMWSPEHGAHYYYSTDGRSTWDLPQHAADTVEV